MKNPFFLLGAKSYKGLKTVMNQKENRRIYKELQQLYPLENADKLLEQFQKKKLTLMLGILTIGFVSAICFHLCSRMESRLAEGTQLVRNEWGVGSYKIMLRARVEDWSRKIPFLVEERSMTQEEQDSLQKKLYEELPDFIKKENSDLAHINSDLNLVSSVSGYPFHLTWSSSEHQRISKTGKVNQKGIKTKEKIELTVMVSYGQTKSRHTYEVWLLPEALEEEERFFRSLEEKLSVVDLEGKSQKEILLPESLEGKNIVWEEIQKNDAVYLLLLTILGCKIAGKGMESDLKKDCAKRKRQLILDYSGFVNKFRLYLSAGLTVKNAFYRIMEDYGHQQVQKKRKYLYEEMRISCFQLENGATEEQVYREFGKRCGETRYRRLSFLLTVHLKQGNDQLLALLSQEADGAWEDRRNMAKKAGEEAGTKLLFPMMLMLVVVMFLILLPAYLDFGSI